MTLMFKRFAFIFLALLYSSVSHSDSIYDFDELIGTGAFSSQGLLGYQGWTWGTGPQLGFGLDQWGLETAGTGENIPFSGDHYVRTFGGQLVQDIFFNEVVDVVGAYFNVWRTADPSGEAPETLQFLGYDQSNHVIGSSDILQLDRESSWQWLGANLQGVWRLEILATQDNFNFRGVDTDAAWWGMDNFTLGSPELNPVPLPAAAWLFGTGLLGLIGFKWRRKAA
jgi:hypothetical protein